MQPRKKAAPLPEDSANSGASDSDETGKADITALLNKLRQTVSIQMDELRRRPLTGSLERTAAQP